MSLLRRALHAGQKLVPDSHGGVTILGYHLVGGGTESPIDLPLEVFRQQMDELRRLAEVCNLDRALELLGQDPPSETHAVVLTFDDGYQNFYKNAWPVLQEYRFPAILYVQVDFLTDLQGGPIRQAGRFPPLSWAQLRELAANELITIGSHSCSHADLRALNGSALEHELKDSKSVLEEQVAQVIDSFCYPRGQWSASVERQVAAHYRTAVIRGGRTMRPADLLLHRLERVPIRRDMPVSLRPVVEASVWLEEWCASKIRHTLF